MHVDHQQGYSRQQFTSYIKDVLLSHAIRAVCCHFSHRITLPRVAYSSWRVSQVFHDKIGKAILHKNLRLIPALKRIFFNMYSFSHQHKYFTIFEANMPLIYFYFSLFFGSFSQSHFFQSPALTLFIPVLLPLYKHEWTDFSRTPWSYLLTTRRILNQPPTQISQRIYVLYLFQFHVSYSLCFFQSIKMLRIPTNNKNFAYMKH